MQHLQKKGEGSYLDPGTDRRIPASAYQPEFCHQLRLERLAVSHEAATPEESHNLCSMYIGRRTLHCCSRDRTTGDLNLALCLQSSPSDARVNLTECGFRETIPSLDGGAILHLGPQCRAALVFVTCKELKHAVAEEFNRTSAVVSVCARKTRRRFHRFRWRHAQESPLTR